MKLNTPTSFSVRENGNNVTLNWSQVTDLGYKEDGILGYYIYFNDEEIAFTTNTSYTLSNLTSKYGVYSVKAGYQDTTDSLSDAATYTLTEVKNYNLYINGSKITNYNVGNAIDAKLYNGSLVKLLENGVDVTNKATITIKITNSNNEVIANIPTNEPGTYKVTYAVSYASYTNTCYNEIIIE